MASKIQIRRDTAANWASENPILSQGEMGLELDTNLFKFGDGETEWNGLDYANEGSTGGGHTIKSNGTPLTQRAGLNFSSKFTLTDDSGNDETDVTVNITKSDVGLDNVDNTSDTNKPISTATQTALNSKLDSLTTTESKTGSYTLAAGDLTKVNEGKNLKFKSTSGDLTVPTNASVAFPIGVFLGVEGFANVIADTGVTITGTRGDLTIPSGIISALEKTGTNTWTLHNGTADSGGTWGGIDGTITDQTDLVAYVAEELTAKGDALVTTVSKTASYIFGTDASDLTDVNAGKDVIFEMNVASANTFTIPLDSTTNFPIGTVRGIRQTGAGQTTVDKAVGVTLNGPLNAFKLAAQGAIAFIEKTAANTWYINGETVI
jgi:hypothetical protein